MSNTWSDQTVALNPLYKDDRLLGFAVVSTKFKYFYPSSIDYKELLKEAKHVIVFNGYELKVLLDDPEFPFVKHNLASLYYQINSVAKYQTLDDIVKIECYSCNVSDTHYIVCPDEAKHCVIAASFMLKYYMKNIKKINKEILKLDNSLLKHYSTRYSLIKVNQCMLRTDLSIMQKKKWDIERTLFKKVGYPIQNFASIKDPPKSDKEIISLLEDIKLYKNHIEYLEKYLDIKKVKINFDTVSTATGRILCRDKEHNIGLFAPNNEFKKYFYCNDNKRFISADYSRQEAFILATVSKDTQLFKDISNIDFYSKLANWAVSEDSKSIGKIIFYAVIYGSSAHSLSSNLNISEDKAKSIITKISKRYTKLHKWLYDFDEDYNFFGRKLHNNTVNAYIQSTAADLIRMKLIDTLEYNPVLVLSDNIIYRVDSRVVDTVSEELQTTLNNTPFEGLHTVLKASNTLMFDR